jgi:hypothetical protein
VSCGGGTGRSAKRCGGDDEFLFYEGDLLGKSERELRSRRSRRDRDYLRLDLD